MSTAIARGSTATDDVLETRRILDVDIRTHCISLSACQRNLHEERSSPVWLFVTRCSWPRHIFATKQNAQPLRRTLAFFHLGFFVSSQSLVTVHLELVDQTVWKLRTEHSCIDQQPRFYLWKEKKRRGIEFHAAKRCLCFSRAACASFSVPLSFSFYLYPYFYLPLQVYLVSLSYAEQQNRQETRNERPRFVNANSLSWSARPSTSRWTTNEKSEGERDKGGKRGERARERRRRVSDMTLKCLTRLWTSTGGDAAGVKKRREGVAALDVSRSIND